MLSLLLSVGLFVGHSNLISPIPRNAVDRNVYPWKGGAWGTPSISSFCLIYIEYVSPLL